VLAAVRLDIAASAHLRHVMLDELNGIGNEDDAAKWAHRRMREKNNLNAADAKHVEEAFRAKLLSFAIHRAEGIPAQTQNALPVSNRHAARKQGPRRSLLTRLS
jgi:hypothetical protein